VKPPRAESEVGVEGTFGAPHANRFGAAEAISPEARNKDTRAAAMMAVSIRTLGAIALE
jgi:hypothetical protein